MPRVLIEFGGRNTIEPSQSHDIASTLSEVNSDISLPKANVNMLSPIRTFWEKATLMHVRSHRGHFEDAPERLSRHWYDMAIMSDSWMLKDALSNQAVRQQIIKYNKAFYHSSYAHYDDCLSGKFRLTPENIGFNELKQDYNSMIDAGMFEKEPGTFEIIMDKVQKLEVNINNSI